MTRRRAIGAARIVARQRRRRAFQRASAQAAIAAPFAFPIACTGATTRTFAVTGTFTVADTFTVAGAIALAPSDAAFLEHRRWFAIAPRPPDRTAVIARADIDVGPGVVAGITAVAGGTVPVPFLVDMALERVTVAPPAIPRPAVPTVYFPNEVTRGGIAPNT